MVTQIFMSHTKRDKDCCDRFDSAAARVGVRVFRSEFESIATPQWLTIKDEINKSSALFLLVGKELVNAQKLSDSNTEARESWKHTQNWIAYEIGVACQKGLDVWVICDSVYINFPVPYLNNYDIWGIRPEVKDSLEFAKAVFRRYSEGSSFPLGSDACKCSTCGASFNLNSRLPKNMDIPCPTCLTLHAFQRRVALTKRFKLACYAFLKSIRKKWVVIFVF